MFARKKALRNPGHPCRVLAQEELKIKIIFRDGGLIPSSRALDHNLYLETNVGLVLEVEVCRSTRGGIQRVTPCCKSPAGPSPNTSFLICYSCNKETNFTSTYIPIVTVDGGRAEALTNELAASARAMGYTHLEDHIFAFSLQAVLEELYFTAKKNNS